MKTNNLFKSICCISLMALFLTGCSEKTVLHKIRLSDSSVTFDVTGNQHYTITVESAVKWSVDIENGWILESASDEGSVTITAEANEAYEERHGRLLFTDGFVTEELQVTQLGRTEDGAPKFRLLSDFNSFEMSYGGKVGLAVQLSTDSQDNYFTTPYIIHMGSDQREQLETIPGAYMAGPISDDGSVMFLTDSPAQQSIYWKDGQWVEIPKLSSDATEYCVYEISADGSIWVGFCKVGEKPAVPVKWVNGVPQALDAPTIDGWGYTSFSGTMARGCSEDGSVIYGTIWPSYELVLWRADGTMEVLGEDNGLHKVEEISFTNVYGETVSMPSLFTPSLKATNKHMSPDGKHIACYYSQFVSAGTSRVEQQLPLFLDLVNPDNYVLVNKVTSGTGTAVGNDGSCFYGKGSAATGLLEGYNYDPATGTSISIPQWIKNTFGINVAGEYYVERVCSNGTTVTGKKILQSTIQTNWVPWYITKEGL